MSWFEENKQILIAFVEGIIVFLIFFGMIVAAVTFYDFSQINISALAFILALICAVFLAKSIYDIEVDKIRIKKRGEQLANKLVASSQQLFLEVYNNSPVAYLIVGEYREIVSANTAAARLFGVPTERLVKRDLFSFIETANEEHQSILKHKFTEGIAVSDEEVKISREQEFSWTTFSIFQFSSTDGKKLTLVTFVDITKQKEIDIAKSEFVSLASHQLRTPISGMRWSAELLLMDGVESLTKQQKRYIDRLLSSIQRMSGLVDDFLQVSRFELGTRVVKEELVALSDLFDDVIAEQIEKISTKHLHINTEYDDSITHVSTDLALLRMIITNLYINAIKYSRVNGDITMSYRKNGEEVIIEVRDTGMGIPLGEQSRVFSKIFRASNAVREVPDGTGLGLYIVHKAVQTLQGRVTFLSAENMGTTFTVVIPTSL